MKKQIPSTEDVSTATGSGSGAQAIERALRILLTFSSDSPALTLKEISAQTGLTMPTARRMLKELQRHGFITQPTLATFSLGPAIVRLSQIVLANAGQSALSAICLPYLEQLRNLTGESVGLHIRSGDVRICVAEVESRHFMRMATHVGSHFSLHAGAASKVLLAGLSPEERPATIARVAALELANGHSKSAADLEAEAEKVNRNGYAISQGETVQGASAIAVPVHGPDQTVVGALNICGPAIRWTKEAMLAALPQILDAVDRIERQIGTK